MSSWLINLTTACCHQLQTVGDKLTKMKDRYVYWNDDYYKKSQQLVLQQHYQGKGATAFMQAVDTDINIYRPIYDGIGHASSACYNLQRAISDCSSKYDNEMASLSPFYESSWYIDSSVFDNWRNQLIQMALGHSGGGGITADFASDFLSNDILDSILQSGSSFISTHYYKAQQTVEEIVKNDADAYAQTYIAEWLTLQPEGNQIDLNKLHNYGYPDVFPTQEPGIDPQQMQQIMKLTAEIIQIKQEIRTYYLSAFNQLSNEIEHALTYWANDLYSAHNDFQDALQHSENYLSARDLFDLIQNDDGLYSSQSTTKPITITPYKTKTGTGLLISIGGTDPGDWAWDTDVFTALQTGMGLDNPYLDDVKAALRSYMREHREMTGSEITFAGYSLGGMTAQQMAQYITSGNDQEFRNYDFNVAQVITYGAPVMGLPLGNNIEYNMYDATYDPVPLLSQYENPTVNAS
ncbi:MAG: hypothetical protein JO031_17705, partial [Ktedonobacteraceae bacterium]|nr:hypothetical protein [Ktedonobacteraceae bacterium]